MKHAIPTFAGLSATLAFAIGVFLVGSAGVAGAVQGRCGQVSAEYRVCIVTSSYSVPVPAGGTPIPTVFVFLEGRGATAGLDLIECVEYTFPDNVPQPERVNCDRDRGHQGFGEKFTIHEIAPGPTVGRVDAVLVLRSGERLEAMRTAITLPSF